MIKPTDTKIDLEASQLDEMTDVPAAAFEYLDEINLDGNTFIDGDEIDVAGGQDTVFAQLSELGFGTEQSFESENTFTIVKIPLSQTYKALSQTNQCKDNQVLIKGFNYLTASIEDYYKGLICVDKHNVTNAQFNRVLNSDAGFRVIHKMDYDETKKINTDFCEKNPSQCGPDGKNRPKSDIEVLEEGAHPEEFHTTSGVITQEMAPLTGNALENSTDKNGNMILRGGRWMPPTDYEAEFRARGK